MPEKNKDLLSGISYIFGWLSGILVFFLSKKQAQRFHGLQSTAFNVVVSVIAIAFPPLVLLGLANFYFAWKAYNGEKYKVPYLGDFAEKYSK